MERQEFPKPNDPEKLRGVWKIAYFVFIAVGALWIVLFSVLSFSGMNFDNFGRSGSVIAARGPRGIHVYHK